MNRLRLAFYGDDFTGSTDALEQLTLGGWRAALFIQPPNPRQLRRFPGLQAVGVAGATRAMTLRALDKELAMVLPQLKNLRPRHVHYKVCSTFDSSPTVGSIGRVMEAAAAIFPGPFIPILAAAPALGRYTVFGTHFARYGIGSAGSIHRLDRHPSISHHPVTPMREADLRRHLAQQTKMKIALFDILKVNLPEKKARAALGRILEDKPGAILFDAVQAGHLRLIGALMDAVASQRQPLFSIGSSGIESALAACFRGSRRTPARAPSGRGPISAGLARGPLLIGSGSCSPVTCEQIAWALKREFAEVTMNTARLVEGKTAAQEIQRAARAAAQMLQAGRSVIVHTTRTGPDQRIAKKLGHRTAPVLGTALGNVMRAALQIIHASRICVAGGDTSSFAARALGIEALEMMAPLTPGAPLCRAFAPGSPADGCEVVFKGGQVGPENYFDIVKRGKI
jgi:uncharacterized protein YgbK (DUF1537 family)